MTLRLAVVGVGDVARRDYLPELGRFSELVQVVVACSRSRSRAGEVAESFGIPRYTDSVDEAVSDPGVDAVVNLTPIPAHVDVTLAALRAGKHVYSEKPLAGSVADADRIASEAAARCCVVVAAPSVLLFPQVMRARELLASGELGAVHTARAHGLGGVPPWDGYGGDPAPFFARDTGPLVDMAVYPLHALTGLLGRARRVSALSSRTRSSFTLDDGTRVPVEADDNWHLLVELESGALASVEANNCAGAALAPELELRGERAALGLSLLDVAAPLRIAGEEGERSEEIASGRPGGGPDHALGIAHLAECVNDGTEPEIGIAHARHVLEVIEAARRSVAERRTVEVAT